MKKEKEKWIRVMVGESETSILDIKDEVTGLTIAENDAIVKEIKDNNTIRIRARTLH